VTGVQTCALPICWYEMTIRPYLTFDRKIDGTVVSFLDITGRKKAEEELNNINAKVMIANEKLRVISSLTRHDVGNKLSTLTGNLYLLKKKHSNQADIVESLGKMEQAIENVFRIFDFAKIYEQIGVEELVYVDVGRSVDEATELLSDLPFKIINDCQGLTVIADSMFKQLVYNLIDNTRKYGKKTTMARVYYKKTAQDFLQLIYEDNGIGIPSEKKEQLFKQGFSTGGSTGLGLFLIKKMMDVYNWAIEENGKPNEGAKFTITIPKLDKNGKENYRIKS
jgi:signal transduction histidine kinase